MNQKIQNRVLNLTREMKCLPDGDNKHFTFLVDQSRIVSIGWNQSFKTHPKGKKLGYRFESIHSELAAILRYRGNRGRIRWLTLINTRVNRFDQFGMSKPCLQCQELIDFYGIREVWYTNQNGIMVKL